MKFLDVNYQISSMSAYYSAKIVTRFTILALLISPLFYTDYVDMFKYSYGIYPKGILYFIPPKYILHFQWFKLGIIPALLALFGIWQAITFRLAALSALILASLFYSSHEAFSHQFNFLCISLLCLCLIPFSKSIKTKAEYAIPIILMQFSLAWPFFSAFTYKMFLVSGPMWVLSDNMRNMLLTQNILLGSDSVIRNFFASDVILWKSLAVLNLCLQAMPIFSIFFLKKPYIRLLFGFIYTIESVFLYIVMGRFPSILPFNLDWVLLATVFIDWDFFLKNRLKPVNFVSTQTRAIKNIALCIVILTIVVSYIFNGKDKDFTYPFSATSMFSSTKVKKPYTIHQTHDFLYNLFIVDGEDITHHHKMAEQFYYEAYEYKLKNLDNRKTYISSFNKIPHKSIDIYRTIYTISAYPKNEITYKNIGKIAQEKNGLLSTVAIEKLEGQNILKLSSTNAQAKYKLMKQLITYDNLTTFGKKHSKTIKEIASKEPILGEWITSTDFKFSVQEKGSYLITLNDGETDWYGGLIDCEN
jgi:hypothetical protein